MIFHEILNWVLQENESCKLHITIKPEQPLSLHISICHWVAMDAEIYISDMHFPKQSKLSLYGHL